MVGIVIISHSLKIGEGLKDLAEQMGKDVPISIAAGTKDREIGTDIDEILRAIADVISSEGVLVFFDLGSALINAEMAIELLDDKQKNLVTILDSALVEGVVIAAVQSQIGKTREEIKEELEVFSLNKIQ